VGETIPQLAKRVNVSRVTVWRWISRGIAVGNNVVKLAARRNGGRWSISADAWEQWEAALNPENPLPESPTAQRRRWEREKQEALRRLGVSK
jgi:hypothetical protein